MLERAMPADAVPGSTIPEGTEAQVQLRDGSWVWCEVIGQRKDRQGRWCVGIRWYASPSVGGREGWYVLDRSRIRRFSALTSARPRPCGTGPCPAPPGHPAGAERDHPAVPPDTQSRVVCVPGTCGQDSQP